MVATVPRVMKELTRTIGVAAILVVFTSNCGGAGTDTPTSSSNGVNTTTTTPVAVRAIFLVKNGSTEFMLERIQLSDQAPASDLTDEVRRALNALIEFTGTVLDDYNREQNTQLDTAIPEGITFNNVSIVDGVVSVDFDNSVLLMSRSSSEERLFAQQLAHTALWDPSLTAIRILVNGQPISELWGHLDWSLPITADPVFVVSN